MQYDVAVIGGGIIGLSTAMQILKKFPKAKLIIIEKEDEISKHQTGRNSGVIHSGLYYKPNSLKAKNCIKGRNLLINFCREENIKHEICGKIVVATNKNELEQLNFLMQRGNENKLKGLKYLSKEEIKEREPYCTGEGGIFVPQTGIVNYKEVSKKFLEKIKQFGGEILYKSEVFKLVQNKNNFMEIITKNTTITSKIILNCGGVYSDRLAKMTEKNICFRITPFRGEYFLLKESAKKYIRNLIYPVPNIKFPFLGVHFTKMIDGSIECGPNAVFAFDREGYKKISFNLRDTFDSLTWPGFLLLSKKYWKEGFVEFSRSIFKDKFVEELQKLIPAIKASDLIPGEPGIRAQACGINGDLIDDFYYLKNSNIVNICNAPSPAATASLSISDEISEIVLDLIKT